MAVLPVVLMCSCVSYQNKRNIYDMKLYLEKRHDLHFSSKKKHDETIHVVAMPHGVFDKKRMQLIPEWQSIDNEQDATAAFIIAIKAYRSGESHDRYELRCIDDQLLSDLLKIHGIKPFTRIEVSKLSRDYQPIKEDVAILKRAFPGVEIGTIPAKGLPIHSWKSSPFEEAKPVPRPVF